MWSDIVFAFVFIFEMENTHIIPMIFGSHMDNDGQ